MGTFWILVSLILFVCVLLILVIMVQNPKGGGLSSAFGGEGTQVVGGVQNTNNFLDKSTWTLATILVVLILLSNVSLKGSFGEADSRLLDSSDESFELVPEEVVPEELPAIPAGDDAQE